MNVFSGASTTSASVGDFNIDNKLDLALIDSVGARVSVVLGDGAGGFESPTLYGVGLAPQNAVVGDFDKDGDVDLAAANFGSVSLSMLFNTRNRTISISGRVIDLRGHGMAGVEMRSTGDESMTTATGTDGCYSFSVLSGKSYRLRPWKCDYVFPPPPSVIQKLRRKPESDCGSNELPASSFLPSAFCFFCPLPQPSTHGSYAATLSGDGVFNKRRNFMRAL